MNCPGCGVAEGRWHAPACDWEQCPRCGEQASLCGCPRPPLDDRLRWDGRCSWLDACLAFGLFEREVGGGWESCRPDETGSQPDVARLFRDCRWNRARGRFER